MVQLWDRVQLDRTSPVPLYQQLEAHFEALIEDGSLRPGAKLPATRDLAAKLGINRNTVTSAYEALATKARVHSHVGQGTFVAEPSQQTATSHRWSFSRAAQAAREWVRFPAEETQHPDPIDFATLVPDEDLFPVEPFRVVLDEVLAQQGKKLLQYGPAAGYPPLRRYIAARLAHRGVETTPDNVLVVNGSQQALDLICRTLLDPGDSVVLESPTYTIVLPLLAQYRAEIEEVPMTPRGMDLTVLEGAVLRSRPKLLFTMPTFHNPTGITMDLASRERLVTLATRYRVPIVEDDFDPELRFDGESLPPLKAFDDKDCVMHIGTFSKGLFPGLRLGWIVAPAAVVDALGRSKLISDYHTSLVLQAAVLAFCERGHYDEHLERLAGIYREKRRTLVAALEKYFPENVTWTHPEGGFAFWITLPETLSADTILTEAAAEGVVFTPGGHFFAHQGGSRFFRLSISRVPLGRIEEGVKRLGNVLRRSSESGSKGAGARQPEPALHI